ncbi:MAG: nucleotidyltransferase domain-containing protein [Lentimicrobium sp.]|jgi:predicted nucleotidyltransferase|nr:nucleotidyltransferase domain-containing protein [Lentimicrobium sp.]HAH58571.1 nucleotidyltransferase domain-containing protein [Bacteroidales bacterium]
MDKGKAISLVREYGKLLKDYFPFDKIYLFGSYARNTQQEDSDINVAIVVSSMDKDFFEIQPLLWKLRRQIDHRIEPILIESENDDSGFLFEIQRHGIEIV